MGYGGITIAKGQNSVFAMRLEPGTELCLKRHFPFGHENEGGKMPAVVQVAGSVHITHQIFVLF